ncbi:hypothetical protein BCR35DRAFT_304389 [Leucosporidium creatinivorum]|uniref:Uncharacterized protein n=1 Tax=Leucosporidium creatinivorum TaxID=106004 RepID=A0A1Y2F9U8_9BASI|nr:hypothetical protein BCR35DRAFT_304389 [Leucosporidium creatinivorum]
MKAEKDREREKARIKELLGGGKLRLIDLWDPEGKEESTAAIERANRRRRLAAVDLKSGYPTPPSSSDGHRPSIPLTLDSFDFLEPPPPTVGARWRALNDQIERFRLAKERAAKAREEERERRKEKEQEAAAQAQAEDASQANASKAPPPPPAVKRNSSAAVRPPVNPTSTNALNDRSPNVPIVSPTTYTNEPPVPPAPPRKPKKGKKKRSAHANALNVHHRDNYVPSRIPTSSTHHHNSSLHHDGSTTPPLTSWPASEEAIAAAGGSRPNTSYFAGPDEWLCAFCDYDLFFGPDPRKAIKKRKDVLKVRRKARERASKAAGGGTAAAPPPSTEVEDTAGEVQATEAPVA